MLATWGWGKKISPFSLARFVGRKQTLKFITGYVKNRQKVDNTDQASDVRDYMYQIFMRQGTTEFGIMLCFSLGLYSKVTPLGHETMLCNKDFPIPVSFMYGDDDWVRAVDENFGQKVVDANSNAGSKYHLVKSAGHNLHMDNPLVFSNHIINDLLDDNLPIDLEPQEVAEDLQDEFYNDVEHMTEGNENMDEDVKEYNKEMQKQFE